MSNTERPVIEWLRTIADPIVRESAIEQCVNPDEIVYSSNEAILCGLDWDKTKEGFGHWCRIGSDLFLQREKIYPAATNWWDEVHTMD